MRCATGASWGLTESSLPGPQGRARTKLKTGIPIGLKWLRVFFGANVI